MKSKQNRSSLLFLFKKTKIYSERANGLWKRSIKSTPPAIRFVAPFISKTQYFWRPKEGAGTRRNRKPNERERVKVNIKKKTFDGWINLPWPPGVKSAQVSDFPRRSNIERVWVTWPRPPTNPRRPAPPHLIQWIARPTHYPPLSYYSTESTGRLRLRESKVRKNRYGGTLKGTTRRERKRKKNCFSPRATFFKLKSFFIVFDSF